METDPPRSNNDGQNAQSEFRAIRAKSRDLLHKIQTRLGQIDPDLFPTETSRSAHRLLAHAVQTLGRSEHLAWSDPAVLYNRLFTLNALVDQIEASNIDKIAWPIVSYCDELWTVFFPDVTAPRIFYTITAEHNYFIVSFSQRIRKALSSLLPDREIDMLLKGPTVYCLSLASLEHQNLPLYANIPHEFGHAIHDHYINDLVDLQTKAFDSILTSLAHQLDAQKASQDVADTLAMILQKCGEELFSDLVASLLVGPAFFLSLYEMSWGLFKTEWRIVLADVPQEMFAYPSYAFRLECVRAHSQTDGLESALQAYRAADVPHWVSPFESIRMTSQQDSVRVRPDHRVERNILTRILTQNLPALKRCYGDFLSRCSRFLSGKLTRDSADLAGDEVAELLRRIENDIPPNILPDGSLRGQPASFQGILNAASILRINTLMSLPKPDTGSYDMALVKKLNKIDRLSAKAFEVSYIQKEYDRKMGRDGNSES